MVKYNHRKERAVQFTVDISGDLNEYALSLLHIINNARTNKDTIYKVENSYDNTVYVTCDKGCTKEMTEYLEQFGEIVLVEDINRFIISAEYDKRGWEELFGEDYDVEFAVEID